MTPQVVRTFARLRRQRRSLNVIVISSLAILCLIALGELGCTIYLWPAIASQHPIAIVDYRWPLEKENGTLGFVSFTTLCKLARTNTF